MCRGLEPDLWYWYQFKVGSEVSWWGERKQLPGQTLTSSLSLLPLLPAKLGGLLCRLKHMAQRIWTVVHLGGYIL